MPRRSHQPDSSSTGDLAKELQHLSIEMLVEVSGILIVGMDQQGRIKFISQSCEELSSYSRQEVLGKSFFSLLVSEGYRAKARQAFKQAIGGIVPTQFVSEWVLKSGEHRVIEWRNIVSTDTKGAIQSIFAIGIDITESVHVEEGFRSSNQDLEFYALLLRHDIGNDLQVIISSAELIRMLLPPGSEVQESSESIEAAANRIGRLLNILGHPEKDVETEIIVLLERLGAQATKAHKGLTVVITAPPEIRNLRVARGRFLPLVFDNLFRNAAKHAGLSPKVNVKVAHISDHVQIDVIDNGPGIPAEIRPKLFQSGVSTTGGGLGLYLSRLILEFYGGSIDILDTAHEQGAAFRITLQLALQTEKGIETLLDDF